MIKEHYRSSTYGPEKVTGRYVRKLSDRDGGGWRVFETATGQSGRFKGKPGMGPTLREYDTDGDGLPEHLQVSWNAGTVKWD